MRLKLPVVIAVLLASNSIWAHHGSAGFDRNKPVHFAGKVIQVEWVNPHVVLHIAVAGADGTVATWLVNTLPPNAAKRIGFPQSYFAEGKEVAVDGYQALDGSNHVNGTSLMFKDGQNITTPDCFDANQHCFTPSDGKGKRIE